MLTKNCRSLSLISQSSLKTARASACVISQFVTKPGIPSCDNTISLYSLPGAAP